MGRHQSLLLPVIVSVFVDTFLDLAERSLQLSHQFEDDGDDEASKEHAEKALTYILQAAEWATRGKEKLN